MIIAYLVVLGLCFGSFVNAFVWRIRKHKNWINDRSVCPKCKQVLSAADLVPVLSWLALKGKCRYCHKKISWQYPLVELTTAALFVVSYLFWPDVLNTRGWFHLVVWLVILVGLMALVVYDFRWMLLPNKIVYPLTIIAAAAVIVDFAILGGGAAALRQAMLGLATTALPFYIMFQVSAGKWIGGGDVKLGMLIGLLVGSAWGGLLVIFLASFIGLVWVAPDLIRRRVRPNSRIPFGPFLILGLIIVRLFGSTIIAWYTRHVFYIV